MLHMYASVECTLRDPKGYNKKEWELKYTECSTE